jgi:hypothetical protein
MGLVQWPAVRRCWLCIEGNLAMLIPQAKPLFWEDWDEYFWDDEWVVQGTSLGNLEERPEHVTAQFGSYKPFKRKLRDIWGSSVKPKVLEAA